MGFFANFKNIFTSKNKKSTPQIINNLGDYSLSKSNKVLSAQEFLSIGYISRAIQLIANDFSKINFIHKIRDKRVLNSNIEYLLNKRPNNIYTPWELKKLLIWDLLIYGKAAWFKFSIDNKLKEIFPIYPAWINKVLKNGEVFYELSIPRNSDQAITWNVEKILLSKNEIIYFDYELINTFDDVHIRSLFKSTITKIKENEINLMNGIKNDLGYSLMLKIPNIANAEQKKEAIQSLSDMIARQKQDGSLAMVLDEKWEVSNAATIINTKIDYSTRNALGREISSILGIPASKLGVEDSNKYNTLVERNRAYIDDAIKPLLINVSQRLTYGLLLDKLDENITYMPLDLLQLDPNSIREFGVSAINNAIATPNEIRNLIGFDKIDNGDELLANSAILPVSLNIERVKSALLDEIEKQGKEKIEKEQNANK